MSQPIGSGNIPAGTLFYFPSKKTKALRLVRAKKLLFPGQTRPSGSTKYLKSPR
jgi:hypothetical protein